MTPLEQTEIAIKGCGEYLYNLNKEKTNICGEDCYLCSSCKNKAIGLLIAYKDEKEFIEKLTKRIHRNFDRPDLLQKLRDERVGVCQVCKGKSGNQMHHIMPRRLKGKDNLNNLILICKECHTLVDSLLYQGDMTSRIDCKIRVKQLTSAIELLEKAGVKI